MRDVARDEVRVTGDDLCLSVADAETHAAGDDGAGLLVRVGVLGDLPTGGELEAHKGVAIARDERAADDAGEHLDRVRLGEGADADLRALP